MKRKKFNALNHAVISKKNSMQIEFIIRTIQKSNNTNMRNINFSKKIIIITKAKKLLKKILFKFKFGITPKPA